MRSAFAFAAVTAVFAGTLVGGLSYTGALDPAMLRGPKEDRPGAARAGWKTHSVPTAGFSIQLPPEWHGAPGKDAFVFRAHEGKAVVATLTVVPSDQPLGRKESATTRRFVRGDHELTFSTSQRFATSFARIFEQAADTFRAQ